jgi:hypothetical protein
LLGAIGKGRRKRQRVAKASWADGKFASAAGPPPPGLEGGGEDSEEESEGEEGDDCFTWRSEWFGSDAEGDDEAEGGDAVDEGTGDVADCHDVDKRNAFLLKRKGWKWADFMVHLADAVPAADKVERKRAGNAARSMTYDKKKRKEETVLAAKGTMPMTAFMTSGIDPWTQQVHTSPPRCRLWPLLRTQHPGPPPSLTPAPRTCARAASTADLSQRRRYGCRRRRRGRCERIRGATRRGRRRCGRRRRGRGRHRQRRRNARTRSRQRNRERQ